MTNTPSLPAELARRLREMARETADLLIVGLNDRRRYISILQEFAEAVADLVAQQTREQDAQLVWQTMQRVRCLSTGEEEGETSIILTEDVERELTDLLAAIRAGAVEKVKP